MSIEKLDKSKLGVIEEIKGENGITHTIRDTNFDVIAEKINEIIEHLNLKESPSLE